jgi:negative regulator of sigma E activity
VFWTDLETGLVLRDEGFDASGRRLEASRFETIEFGVPSPLPDLGAAEAEEPARLRSVACDALADAVGFEPFVPGTLPEGFRLVACHVREGSRRSAVLVYGDGLAQFVISEVPTGAAERRDTTEDEVEVRRRERPGETHLGLRLDGTRIDVRSRTLGSRLLLDVVASLKRGGRA